MIRVKKWKEWECDPRTFPLTKGQRLLLLLDQDGGHYGPINASTGEGLIEADTVELYHERSTLVGSTIRGYRMHLNEFREAARALRRCATMTGEHADEFGYFPGSARWTCDEAAIAACLE